MFYNYNVVTKRPLYHVMTADVWQTVFFLMNSILELSKKSNMGFNLQRRGAKMLVKTQFATSIKVVRSDNGQEF